MRRACTRTLVNVANDGFQFVHVREEALTAAFGDAVYRQRSTRTALFFRRDDAQIGQCVHVPVEITVGEIASGLKFGKAEAGGVRDQTRADRQPATFVKDSLQAGIRERRLDGVAHDARPCQIKNPIAI